MFFFVVWDIEQSKLVYSVCWLVVEKFQEVENKKRYKLCMFSSNQSLSKFKLTAVFFKVSISFFSSRINFTF